jgi:hypothetical protein
VPNCCAHSLCATGAALDAASCSFGNSNNDCAPDVCAKDPFCCSSSWDAVCTSIVQDPTVCPTGNSTQSSYTCSCAHSYCVQGAALSRYCDPCVDAICEKDSFCCSGSWDQMCVQAVNTTCNVPTGANCK